MSLRYGTYADGTRWHDFDYEWPSLPRSVWWQREMRCCHHRSITHRLVERYAHPAPVPAPARQALATLSPRELEVLRLLARGLANVEIADALHLSEATAKTHVAHILPKLGLRDRVQAVVFAYETGLVRPGSG
jgi:DNA-binding NarL/FixJ family response regulator